MKITGRLCLFGVLCSITVHAQTFNMSMDKNLPAWNPCVLPDCQPGGIGIPTNIVIAETGTAWPPNSLKLAVTGPEYTNFLAWDKVGATSATYFNSDFWVDLPGEIKAGGYQALEYDIFQFLNPYEFMWGSECVMGGQWQIWDHLHGEWLNTTRPCQMNAPGWYHVQWWVHRVDGDTSCDGYPCMYYDMLGVNGVYTQFETTEPAGPIPAGWSNDSGLNFQLDISGLKKSATISEYIQNVNLTEMGN
ncbi:MAG TPA: hypothetical protein VK722_05510 [Candidatus Aquilonibacter sp.]|jgi:hypothetical protein|nr:hypothetical protein [Candidatus Aquilonibacter sp.]